MKNQFKLIRATDHFKHQILNTLIDCRLTTKKNPILNIPFSRQKKVNIKRKKAINHSFFTLLNLNGISDAN